MGGSPSPDITGDNRRLLTALTLGVASRKRRDFSCYLLRILLGHNLLVGYEAGRPKRKGLIVGKFIVKVTGPFKVPIYVGKGGRSITDDGVKEFWQTNKKYENRKGCYLFAIRAGKGYTPGYVGKATNRFGKEVFEYHKLTRYQQFLVDYAKGTPTLFFLVAKKKKGKPNNSQISQIEKYLIDLAITANPNLLNQKSIKPPKWGIQGVIRGEKGKVTSVTKVFRKMLGID